MPIPKHESWWQIILRESIVYDVGIAIGSGAVAAGKALEQKLPNEPRLGWMFWCAVIVSLLSVAKTIAAFVAKKKQQSVHELEGCLHAMQGFLVAAGGEGVRVTIHVPIENGQKLEQLFDYVGCEPNNRAGRTFAAQSGVVGRALREKETIAAARKSDIYADYIRELINEYHFTQRDAEQCNPGVYSFLAIPLFKDGGTSSEVEGVVFADSTKKDFFTDQIAKTCIGMSTGIARFIKQRYKA